MPKYDHAEARGVTGQAQAYGRMLAMSNNWRAMTKRIPSIYE